MKGRRKRDTKRTVEQGLVPGGKAYLLVASGSLKLFSGRSQIISKNVFMSRSRAEGEKEAFRARCCETTGVSSLRDIDPETISIDIIELDVI